MVGLVRNAASTSAGAEVEKFAAAPGRWFGWAIVVLSGGLAAFLVVGQPTQDRRAIYAVGCIWLLSWVMFIRPVVSIHANGVLLRNMVRDTFVPWSKIERCRAFQTLQVVTDEARFHGLGVSRTARSMLKQSYGRSSITFGLGGMSAGGASDATTTGGGRQNVRPDIAYQDYVETRIESLARDAEPDDLEPVVAWVWHAVAAVAVSAALVVLLVL